MIKVDIDWADQAESVVSLVDEWRGPNHTD